MNKIALEFIQFVLLENPEVRTFGDIYDAMSRVASRRTFHGLGYRELSQVGISFSLLDTVSLELLIARALETLPHHYATSDLAQDNW